MHTSMHAPNIGVFVLHARHLFQYEHTLSERKILQDIDHPFLVGLRASFQSPSKLFMVFDFFNGGELYSYVRATSRPAVS
jgi:serine/threonine protein kinase